MRSRTLTRESPLGRLVLTAVHHSHDRDPYLYPRVCRGNWGVDLQAGSQYGYKLLFVVLLAGIFAVFLQVRSTSALCDVQGLPT